MFKKARKENNQFQEKKIVLLTNEQQESYEKGKIWYICGATFEDKYSNDEKYYKVRDQRHYTSEYGGAADSICNLKYCRNFSEWIKL